MIGGASMPIFGQGRKPPEEPKPIPVASDQELDELQRIYANKFLNLLSLRTKAGDIAFTPDDALHLLENPRLDWHEAERLLAKGCPSTTVIRLLEE